MGVFVHFSGAEVLPVSMVAVQGRAVVPVVSLGDCELRVLALQCLDR